MTNERLREELTQLVSQYDDPQAMFKDSVAEFMTMYELRHDQPQLIEYMLETEYAPGQEEAEDFAKEFMTAESVVHELDYYLCLIAELGLMTHKTMPVRIQRKRVSEWRKPDNTVSVCRPGKWANP